MGNQSVVWSTSCRVRGLGVDLRHSTQVPACTCKSLHENFLTRMFQFQWLEFRQCRDRIKLSVKLKKEAGQGPTEELWSGSQCVLAQVIWYDTALLYTLAWQDTVPRVPTSQGMFSMFEQFYIKVRRCPDIHTEQISQRCLTIEPHTHTHTHIAKMNRTHVWLKEPTHERSFPTEIWLHKHPYATSVLCQLTKRPARPTNVRTPPRPLIPDTPLWQKVSAKHGEMFQHQTHQCFSHICHRL